MVKSKIRKDLLLSTLVLTLFVFLLGYYIGGAVDRLRVDDVSELLASGELDVESFLLEQEFFETFSDDACAYADVRLSRFSEAIVSLGQTLQAYEQQDLTRKSEYTLLRNRYFLLELKYYTLLKDMAEQCGDERNVVLFFYDIGDHRDSLRQGSVLDKLVQEDPSLVVLSIDRGFDNSFVSSVVEFYNVAVTPTLIVNREQVFEGFVSEGELRAQFY